MRRGRAARLGAHLELAATASIAIATALVAVKVAAASGAIATATAGSTTIIPTASTAVRAAHHTVTIVVVLRPRTLSTDDARSCQPYLTAVSTGKGVQLRIGSGDAEAGIWSRGVGLLF